MSSGYTLGKGPLDFCTEDERAHVPVRKMPFGVTTLKMEDDISESMVATSDLLQ